MADRRDMSQAMDLSPKKMAFITGRSVVDAAPVQQQTTVPTTSTEETDSVETREQGAEVQVVASTGERPRRQVRPRESSSRSHEPGAQLESTGLYGPLKVPLTVRLNPQTADALRRACLEQKLARRTPCSQQEIAEIAISRWLRDHRHL